MDIIGGLLFGTVIVLITVLVIVAAEYCKD